MGGPLVLMGRPFEEIVLDIGDGEEIVLHVYKGHDRNPRVAIYAPQSVRIDRRPKKDTVGRKENVA
jgi:hypothetical protein